MSALVATAVCSYTSQAVPTNRWICGGVVLGAIGAGTAAAIAFGVKGCSTNSSSSMSEKDAFNERVEMAKTEIIKCIGEKKYGILCKIWKRAKFDPDESWSYLGIDPDIVKKITLLRYDDGLPNGVSELSGNPLSLFLGDTSMSGEGKFCDISLIDVQGVIDDSFKPICGGSCRGLPYYTTEICQDKDFGNGFGFCDFGSEYSIFVSNGNNLVKLCYRRDANCNAQFTFVLSVGGLL